MAMGLGIDPVRVIAGLTVPAASPSLPGALGELACLAQHFVPHIFFGLDPMMVSTVILCVTYGVIIWDKLNRAIVALLGASVMVVVGALDQNEALKGIDWNTIGLLTGMMILVSISRRSGMFEYLAIWSAQKAKASPAGILLLLQITTAVVSALLDNVTTVLLVVPVTLAITRELDVPPYPFLFAEVFASNIGGTATLIGDPPNILIGSHGRPRLQCLRHPPHAGDHRGHGGASADDPSALGQGAQIDPGAARAGHGHERDRDDPRLDPAQAVARGADRGDRRLRARPPAASRARDHRAWPARRC